MKKFLFATAIMFFPLLSSAEDSQWAKFTSTPVDGLIWEYKRGSLDVIGDDSKNIYWTVFFRTTENGKKYNFVKVAINTEYCGRQGGKLYLLDTDNTKLGEVSFVFSGGTLGSAMAESICKAGNLALQELEKRETEPKKISA